MAKSMSLNAAAGFGGMLKDGHKTYEGNSNFESL
jgi:hypothetical protein